MDFVEVMREQHRMCQYYTDNDYACYDCPLGSEKFGCEPTVCRGDLLKLDEWETQVMNWSKAHPTNKYCTIGELATWICMRMGITPSLTVINSTPISEEVARELNLVPINEQGLNKYAN